VIGAPPPGRVHNCRKLTIYGIRVNHLLEVHVDGFGVSKGT